MGRPRVIAVTLFCTLLCQRMPTLSASAAAAAATPATGPTRRYLEVASGDRVELQCRVEHGDSSRQQVIWLRDTNILSLGRDVFSTDFAVHGDDDVTYNLVLGSADMSHEGVYQCQAPPLTVVSFRLTVNERPSITLFYPATSHTYVHLGGTLQLECRATGKPPPSVQWTKLGEAKPLASSSQLVSIFVVEEVTSQHTGVYECMADNGFGIETRQIEVDVIYKPVVTIVRSIHVGIDEVIELVCVIDSNPESQVIWKHNGSEVNNLQPRHVTIKNTKTTDSDVSILRLNKVQLSDVGVYACEAINRLGVTADTCLVTGVPDKMSIISDDLGQYCDQYTIQWSVRSLSQLQEAEIRLSMLGDSYARRHSDAETDKLIQLTLPKTARDEYGQRTVQYLIDGLETDTTYGVRLRTSNIFGFSNWTTEFIFETAPEGHTSPPRNPSRTGAQDAHSRIQTNGCRQRDVIVRLLAVLPIVLFVM